MALRLNVEVSRSSACRNTERRCQLPPGARVPEGLLNDWTSFQHRVLDSMSATLVDSSRARLQVAVDDPPFGGRVAPLCKRRPNSSQAGAPDGKPDAWSQ